MPDLNFEIISAEVKPYSAIPTLCFKLQITNEIAEEEVYAASLKCQILIEATKRTYSNSIKENLKEVFGEPTRWDETVKGLFWTTINIPVPRFMESTCLDVLVGSYEDHLVAAGKYFYSVNEGDIPLAFLFSGTLFYKNKDEELQVTQVPWHKEALYKMPSSLWKDMITTYFPNSRWLRIRNDIFDKLYKYKSRHSFADFENCLESIIDDALGKENFPIQKTLSNNL